MCSDTSAGALRASRTPCARLAAALAREPLTLPEIDALKHRLGLDGGRGLHAGRVIASIKAGRATADSFLAAHAVKGWDPLTSRPADPLMPPARGAVLWHLLGIALRIDRELFVRSLRKAAALARVDIATLSRAENGMPIGADNLLRLCAVLDRHPHDFQRPLPAGFTGNIHCNALKSHSLPHAAE